MSANCEVVRASLWEIASRTMGPEQGEMATHLSDCRECALFALEVNSMRSGLKHLPVHMPSALLATKLQVIASRERSRLLIRRDPKTWAREIFSRAKMWFDDLLKPLAVPATGGILASMLCFGVIADTVTLPTDASFYGADVPIRLFSEVAISDVSPFAYTGPDVTVELTIDAHGDVVDYVPQATATQEQMKGIGNLVLFSTFTPLVRFGQPVSSKRLVQIVHVNVKG